MILVRNETRLEYNRYELHVTDELINDLLKDIEEFFNLDEGAIALTSEDIANIWNGFRYMYAEDTEIGATRLITNAWGEYETSVYGYIREWLGDAIWEQDPWTEDSETEDWTDSIEG